MAKRKSRIVKGNGRKERPFVVTPGGMKLHLQNIDAERIFSMQTKGDEPEPPMKELETVGGGHIEVPDTDDKDYKEAKTIYETRKLIQQTHYSIVRGIVEDPPKEVVQGIVEELAFYEGDPSPHPFDIKYEWVKSLYAESEDGIFQNIAKLSTKIIGMVMPSEEGVEEAEDRFPGDVSPEQGPVGSADQLEATSQKESEGSEADASARSHD